MPLFQQKQGLMAQTMGSTPQRKLMGLPEFAGTSPRPEYISKYKQYESGDTGISYKDMSGQEAESVWAARNMPGQAPLSQEIQSRYGLDQYGRPTAQLAEQQRLRGVAQERQRLADAQQGLMMPSPQASQPQAQPQAQAGVVTENYAPDIRGPYDEMVNRYTDEYAAQQGMLGSSQVARQFGQTREALRARLAASGISPESPLFQSMMAKLSSEESAAKGAEFDRRQQFAAQQSQQFELARAQGRSDWKKFLFDASQELAYRPTKIGTAQAQMQGQLIQNTINSLNAEEKRRTMDAIVEDAINKAGLSGVERDAAKAALLRADPNQWYNSPLWQFLAPAAGAIIGGIFGGPAGAMAGISLGGALSGQFSGQDALAMQNMASGLMLPTQWSTPQIPQPRGLQTGRESADTRRGKMSRPNLIPITQPVYTDISRA